MLQISKALNNKIQAMRRFGNQVAVITGGAEGLGFGIAKRLASEGATVVLFDNILDNEIE